MRAGRIVLSGTRAEIVAGQPCVISFRTPDREAPPLVATRVDCTAGHTIVETDDLQQTLATLLAWADQYDVRLDDLSARAASLESIFLDVAEGRGAATRPGHPPRRGDGSMTARVLGLAHSNALLMRRNLFSVVYAVAVPLLPLAILAYTPEKTGRAGAAPLSLVLLMALLFPVYYNLLSMFVTRRDELVLKRLRSGEAGDAEIIVSMALPGVALVFVVAGIAAVVAGSSASACPPTRSCSSSGCC